jgi:rare lipoprotein A
VRPTIRAGKTPAQLHWACCRRQRDSLRLALAVAFSLGAVAGCAHHHVTQAPVRAPLPQPSVAPSAPPRSAGQQPEYVEEGVASWYGVPFNGHRTSNGEIYDMYQMTAAHRTLPFGAVVRVTNLRNGKQTEVRINDRGPFVVGRIIDLSLSAAQAIEMIGTGTAPVRLEAISGPDPSVGFFGVQVGAFLVQENAERLKVRLAARYPPVAIAKYALPNGIFYRVRVGRLTTEDAARQLADQLRSDEQVATFVVRLDE